MESCQPASQLRNVGLAFGLVTAAGLSTSIGAALAFCMPRSRGGKNLFLAAALAIAAGVMLFVSFVEIFGEKAVKGFQDCLPAGRKKIGYLLASVCFFCGILITYIFEIVLHYVEHFIAKRKHTKEKSDKPGDSEDSEDSEPVKVDLENQSGRPAHARPTPPSDEISAPSPDAIEIDEEVGHDGYMVADIYRASEDDSRALIRMGIFAGIALAFHNFPEGLATFVSVMAEPQVGASVAIAIAIHNIPEGICVAIPIYYATGSRWKGFIWATLSGVSELVGALLGYAVLRKVFSQTVYGVLFGIVAGMMVYISLKELLPTAHKYDPEDKVTTHFLIVGMVVMSLSLVLFKL